MFANLLARIKEELAYQHDLAEVEAMDDRQLADIGVSRFDLAAALRAGRRGNPLSSAALATRNETEQDAGRRDVTRLAA